MVVGWVTAPTQVVIQDERYVLLMNFLDDKAHTTTIARMLADPAAHRAPGPFARLRFFGAL
jgi:hypothetical protein